MKSIKFEYDAVLKPTEPNDQTVNNFQQSALHLNIFSFQNISFSDPKLLTQSENSGFNDFE